MDTDQVPTIPRAWLQEEFNRRRARNASYSLRAFARFLELPPGRLSEIISNKRAITVQLGEKIAERLALGPSERSRFLDAIARGRAARRPMPALTAPAEPSQLSIDAFHAIADWYHFAILSLLDTLDFESDVKWISGRLGISTVEARSALERLERLGLVRAEATADAGTRWILTTGKLTTTHDVTSAALRRSHRQTLEQTIESLEAIPVELRDITSNTVAIDVSKLGEAKKLIRQFRRSLAAFLEDGPKSEVYNINVQLVPVTKLRSMVTVAAAAPAVGARDVSAETTPPIVGGPPTSGTA